MVRGPSLSHGQLLSGSYESVLRCTHLSATQDDKSHPWSIGLVFWGNSSDRTKAKKNPKEGILWCVTTVNWDKVSEVFGLKRPLACECECVFGPDQSSVTWVSTHYFDSVLASTGAALWSARICGLMWLRAACEKLVTAVWEAQHQPCAVWSCCRLCHSQIRSARSSWLRWSSALWPANEKPHWDTHVCMYTQKGVKKKAKSLQH